MQELAVFAVVWATVLLSGGLAAFVTYRRCADLWRPRKEVICRVRKNSDGKHSVRIGYWLDDGNWNTVLTESIDERSYNPDVLKGKVRELIPSVVVWDEADIVEEGK